MRAAPVVHLNIGHDRERAIAWLPDGGLELRDDETALLLTADLPPIPAADRALDEVRSGAVGGLSVEFRAVQETVVAGIRVIQEAILSGVGLVDFAFYTRPRASKPERSGGACGSDTNRN